MSREKQIPGTLRLRIETGTLLGLMLIAGCGGVKAPTSQQPELVSGLQLQKVHLQSVTDELEAPGSVIAASTAQVAARTMGAVMQVHAKEGDLVKRGQLLAQLDERELSARRSAAVAASQGAEAGVLQVTKAVAAAQAQADLMQKTFDRYTFLKEQKSVSPQELDEVSAKYHAAQAALEQSRAGLHQAQAIAAQAEAERHAAQDVASYARIVAPFDGRVIRRSVEPGSLVSPGMLLFVVEDSNHYQLEATLPAEALNRVKKNSPARVQLDEMGQKSLAGKAAEIEAGADSASHTLKARIDLPRDPYVRSGVFGRAFFPLGEKRVLVAPGEAIVTRGQLRGLYVRGDDQVLHWRVVTLGRAIGGLVEVLSGLNDGEIVVLNAGIRELDGKKSDATPTSGEKHP